MPDSILSARSTREIELFLSLVHCAKCGRSTLRGTPIVSEVNGMSSVTVTTTCENCNESVPLHFRVDGRPTDRSRLIDVGQWLTLYSVAIESVRREREKTSSRRLAMESAANLNEALLFYDDDNELPAADAFFTEESRARFREHPQQFSRHRLLSLRAQLPTASKFDAGAS